MEVFGTLCQIGSKQTKQVKFFYDMPKLTKKYYQQVLVKNIENMVGNHVYMYCFTQYVTS